MGNTLAVIGERWTLLVLREAFLGVRRFEQLQRNTGVARNILTDRLNTLVLQGVLRRERYQERPERFEYRLTEKGLDLHPLLMAIVHWGDVHMAGKRGRPLLHRHKACGKDFDPVTVCSQCGEPVDAGGVHVHPGPGARREARA